jgi:hypothetical protein
MHTHARTTDPASSHETVESIVQNRVSVAELGTIIVAEYFQGEWFTDDGIAQMVAMHRPNAVRNNLARMRLQLERSDPPLIVRVAIGSISTLTGKQRLTFRLAEPGDQPLLTLPEQRPVAFCPHCRHCSEALNPIPSIDPEFGVQLDLFGK